MSFLQLIVGLATLYDDDHYQTRGPGGGGGVREHCAHALLCRAWYYYYGTSTVRTENGDAGSTRGMCFQLDLKMLALLSNFLQLSASKGQRSNQH